MVHHHIWVASSGIGSVHLSYTNGKPIRWIDARASAHAPLCDRRGFTKAVAAYSHNILDMCIAKMFGISRGIKWWRWRCDPRSWVGGRGRNVPGGGVFVRAILRDRSYDPESSHTCATVLGGGAHKVSARSDKGKGVLH